MVLGIGEGNIDIIVDRIAFQRGETITGKVVLKLSQPKKAKELRIALIGERETRKTKRVRAGTGYTQQSYNTTEVIFNQNIPLDGEKEYPAGEKAYDFEFKAPDIGSKAPEGVAGIALSIAASVLGGAGPIRWRLDASLNLPMAFDINKKLALNIA